MTISEFSLRLQEGIAGGFAPPTPNAIHTITQPENSNRLMITKAERPHGTPELQELAPKEINAEDKHTSELVKELHEILQGLPMESPPGSQDIYGLDTSIAFGSGDFMWVNGGPQGCGDGTSDVQATEDQKLKFKRAVAIVKELSNKDA